MLSRIIFCLAVLSAILVVVLLALFSPAAHKKPATSARPWFALSLYIQQPHVATTKFQPTAADGVAGAFIFHRTLTEGPDNTSQVVGKAQGFIIPIDHFAHSIFNVIYLTFDTPKYSGSVGLQAKSVDHKNTQELSVVGGTGSFAFARGIAVFLQTNKGTDEVHATYRVKLHLRFPNRSQTISG